MISSSKKPNQEDSSCSISKKDGILSDEAISACEEDDNSLSVPKKRKAKCSITIRFSEGELKKRKQTYRLIKSLTIY